MTKQLTTIVPGILLICSYATAQSPPEFEAAAFVGWSSGGGEWEILNGPIPPHITTVDEAPCVYPGDTQNGNAYSMVSNGTFVGSINSDVCDPVNIASRERANARWEYWDIIYSGPHPIGTPFTFDVTFEYAYEVIASDGGDGGIAQSSLLLIPTGSGGVFLPPTGGGLSTFTVQLNGVIDPGYGTLMFVFSCENNVFDSTDSVSTNLDVKFLPPGQGPVFSNFSIPGVVINSAQANIVNNYWQGYVAPCPADFTGDSVVGVDDLIDLLAAWGTPAGDITGDGMTDVLDLIDMLAGWGNCP